MIRPTSSKLAALLVSCALASIASGCASVPSSEMEVCRKQNQALQAQLAQTKDLAARLRTQNRDMAARAVEDARRLAEVEQSNDHLEKSIATYQEERDQYAAALDEIRRDVAAGTSRSTTVDR
jgi:DNA repair ATPase RecN